MNQPGKPDTVPARQAEIEHTLDEEERDLLRSYEAGEWISVPDFAAEIRRLQEAARSTLAKSERMTIRLTKSDLQALKQCAAKEGVPHHILISSILHKYVTGQLVPQHTNKQVHNTERG
jgi:predicted DNA binding CopG/RHH family protein